MATKTNAVRLVQQAQIPCREAFYEFDPNDLNGNHAAKAIGFPPEQVYKTLVAKGSRTGINVFCIPVCGELDLKKAAKAAGATFVKTSTGFGPAGATKEDIALMRETVGPEMGVKAAGGVRNLDDLVAMVENGATRIGTSGGVAIMQNASVETDY